MAVLLLCLLILSAAAPAARAQSPPPSTEESGQAAGVDPDRLLNPAQPDYTLIALPTTLRVPAGGSAFRVTHRFTRTLGEGDFGSLLENAFGFDGGALVGLEYRRALRRGLQAGVHRTSDRTIQLFALQSLRHQRDGARLGLSALVSVDGTNNFRDEYRPAIGLVVSREFGDRAAVYVQPVWVGNTNPLPADLADDNHTLMVGLAGRLRLRPTLYAVFEATPRLVGFSPGATQVSAGLEKRAGGHAFQVSVSNGLATTMAQLARGGTSHDDWRLGFNISRKF